MKHLGDITKISGYDAPTVNVIIGGSPCQDLSVAGKRAGLQGKRSGLFMEQIRIIKEMREKDARAGRTGADIRPRFMVWENVPGAFSVNGGADFAAVLEETIRVVEQEAPDIQVPRNGWTNSGCFMGGQWSVAWRVLDAQFWGVPQRRRRIALVADFGGQRATEILFERESVSGHSEPCEAEGKGTAGDAADCTGTASVYCLQGNGIDRADTAGCNGRGWTDGACYTLNTIDRPAICYPEITRALCARHDSSPCVDRGQETICIEMTSTKNTVIQNGIMPTLTARMGTGGNQVNAVCINGEVSGTLDASYAKGTGCRSGTEREVVAFDQLKQGQFGNGDVSSTLTSHLSTEARDLIVSYKRYIVRRLTPLECTRLQGYPDGWVDIGDWVDSKGKKHKDADSPKYKALGNSIAIPPWLWVLSRLNAYCDEKTMASLFDGIGGFPLIWEFLNGKGSAVWASEIEEFPIAVTKIRFPEGEE